VFWALAPTTAMQFSTTAHAVLRHCATGQLDHLPDRFVDIHATV
jgi:hypothetical protein